MVRSQQEATFGAATRDHVGASRQDLAGERHILLSATGAKSCSEINLGAVLEKSCSEINLGAVLDGTGKAVTFPWTPYFHDAYARKGDSMCKRLLRIPGDAETPGVVAGVAAGVGAGLEAVGAPEEVRRVAAPRNAAPDVETDMTTMDLR